jgi:hypothetical protein
MENFKCAKWIYMEKSCNKLSADEPSLIGELLSGRSQPAAALLPT